MHSDALVKECSTGGNKVRKLLFHRSFAIGWACRKGTLTPPDTWSRPNMGHANVLLVETKPFSELVVIFRTIHFEHPSVLSLLAP